MKPEEILKILEFCDKTGLREIETCRNYLANSNWNVNIAVDTYSRNRAAAERQSLVMKPSELLSNYTWKTTKQNYSFVLSPSSQPIINNMEVISSYERLLGKEHPIFFIGTLDEALEKCKAEKRVLCMFHIDLENDVCIAFYKEISSKEMCKYFSFHYIIYPADMRLDSRYSIFNIQSVPFVTFLFFLRGQMAIVGKFEGPIENKNLIKYSEGIRHYAVKTQKEYQEVLEIHEKKQQKINEQDYDRLLRLKGPSEEAVKVAEEERKSRQSVKLNLNTICIDNKMEKVNNKVGIFGGNGYILDDRSIAENPSENVAEMSSVWSPINVDKSKPVTTVVIRLTDDTKLKGTFNYTHRIHDIRRFIMLSLPKFKNISFQLYKVLPKEVLLDSATLEESGILNSVIVQSLK